MTQRSPLYVRVPSRQWPRDLLTWVESGPQLGIDSTPEIQSQPDWPNPVRARPNLALGTWLNTLPPGVIGTTPPVVVPFGQTDWPNPRARPRNQDVLSWVGGLPSGQVALTLPPLNYEWPDPRLRPQDLSLRTWASQPQQQPVAVQMPLNQFDWRNPVQRPTSIELRTWAPRLQIQPAVQLPFTQLNWPNPAPRAQNLELRAWVRGIPYSALGNPLPPVRQHGWPNPLPRPANLELRTWAENFSIQAPPGLSDTDVIVPYLIEDVLSAALMRIASIYCVPNVIGSTGSVTAQDPAAFTRVRRGTTITITLGGTIKGSGSRKARAPYGAPDTAPPFPDPRIVPRKH